MNKSAIKTFAVWARTKLIKDIKYKAGMLGITESGIAEPLPISTKDLQFFDVGTKDYTEISGNEIKQREKLVNAIKAKEKSTKTYTEAFEYIVEEVAYTWFNRLIAIRFMEVNDYLPSGIRVLSSENAAKSEPDFVTNPFDTDMEFTPFEQDRIMQLKDENKLDELFRMLFIKECNKLHEILPELFEKTDDYTELLLTISFTDKDGVVYHLSHDIEEKDFNIAEEGQVEIIGWLYQYYNTEPKDTVFANLKKNIKISKENIPAATQLFTPDWIVRYMVENSLGRLWLEGHSNDNLKSEWKYYLDEAEQEPDVAKHLEEIRSEYKAITPEEIKVIDPCMGSGHILVYAFDVLMQIYESYGYTQRDAARSILINNIHGLDIDTRAYQLAYFAVMMKARQYNRRILTEGITPNLFAIRESNEISNDLIKFIANGDASIEKDLTTIFDELYDATEYGSILNITNVNFEQLYNRIEEIKDSFYGDIFGQGYQMETTSVVFPLIKQAQTVAQKYDTVITNPPYMGKKSLNSKLSSFLEQNYSNGKSELYSAFIIKCMDFAKRTGYVAMITIHTWMFINSFENLREHILTKSSINSMMHSGPATFEELNSFNVLATSFILKNNVIDNYKGTYIRLTDYLKTDEKISKFISKDNRFYLSQKDFDYIPGKPFVYWISDKARNNFLIAKTIKHFGDTKVGLQTAENEKFVRYWFEISKPKFYTEARTIEESVKSSAKWFPYNKGGKFRKWYGMNEYVVDWYNDGENIRKDKLEKLENGTCLPSNSKPKNTQYYFKKGITWSLFGFENFGVRYKKEGFIFDISGASLFLPDDIELYVLGYLASKIAFFYLSVLAPTVNFQAGNIGDLPLIIDKSIKENIEEMTTQCIKISKEDWDAFEFSWDFIRHPLVPSSKDIEGQNKFQFHNFHIEKNGLISRHYENWEKICTERYNLLKENEEEMNRLFIQTYNLQNDITPDVLDRDIALRKADLERDIKSLISYAVGCMLGRYSLDVEGLAYAGGEWDNSKYSTFIPDTDNCLPITDEEYFEDDIVGRFVKFIETVYGELTLEENLDFIAKALGNKGNTSREVIRNYFLNDFMKDHIKIYQKRPIYWLYDSGKQNGFKALIYMHRYNADTTGNMRVEYLHRMQRVYEKELERMQEIIDNSRDNKEISAATKRKEKLQKQLKETKDFDAKVAHLALSRIDIDLDDGVKVNYEKVQTASDGTKLQILTKI